MTTDNHTFSNTYMSSIATSRDVADDLKRFWSAWDIQGSTIDELELCVVELVNNAYEHAYNEAEGKPIEIVSHCQNSKIIVDIANFGEGMSQDEFASALEADFIEPDADDPDTWTTSGRGFIILAALVDSVELEHEGEKNTFRLIKSCKSSA
ncbi:ATP-binding protein [Vibrio maritimus]|uniref:ATP-binding protein n=1 Tax=Vibrio maritimus TaxID=990268 RepID=UPI001F31A210|nr:ATP-binding protein [Vibrio maritimus]